MARVQRVRGHRVIEIDGHIRHIETEEGIFVTLICGSSAAALIDTGLGTCSLLPVIEALTDKPLSVYNTHGHVDHIGGNYAFNRVYIHERDLAHVDFYLDQGIVDRVLQANSFEEEAKRRFLAYRGENLLPLDMARAIDLGGVTLLPWYFGTHSEGSVGFFVPESDTLIAGDAVATLVTLHLPYASGRERYLMSLRELQEQPFSHILTAHGEELLPRSLMQRCIECGEAYDPRRTVKYAERYFPSSVGRLFTYAPGGDFDNAVFLVCADGGADRRST